MHIAFLISNVFGCILDCLVDDRDTATLSSCSLAEDPHEAGRKDLVALARTCRAFSEPALNALWRRLDTLQPLILCVPSKPPYPYESGVPLSALNNEEWGIVLRYAPRIQELRLEHDDLSMDILKSLSFRTLLLLPNLRKLHWVYDDYTAFAMIRLLLSPSLNHLHVRLEDGGHTSVLAFLESCHSLSPNIKSLHLDHSGRFPHVTTAISRTISRFPDLEILNCDHIDEAILIRVAGSPYLRGLTCTLFKYHPNDLRRIAGYGTPDHPSFMNLRFLALRVKTLSSIIPCLASQHQPFEEVSFEISAISPPEVFHQFFTALCSAPRCGTLRRVALSVARRSGCSPRVTPEPVDFVTLSPLAALNPCALDIHIKNPISLDDDQLIRLVQGWPRLEQLSLIGNQHCGWHYLPSLRYPTLTGLVRLLARCPKLHDLGLSVDARHTPQLSDDEASVRNTLITNLTVVNAPIREPAANVARFLRQHLPSLAGVPVRPTFRSGGQPDWQWIWRRVDMEIRRDGELQCSSTEWSDDELDTNSS